METISQPAVTGFEESSDDTSSMLTEAGNAADGRFEIILSRYDTLATCNFYPPENYRSRMDIGVFSRLLDRLDIRYGVKWDTIRKAMDECNTERKPVLGVVVAEGEYPQNDIAEYFELEPALNDSRPMQDEEGQIDYKNYTPFVIVKTNQILASLRRRTPGRDGHNLHDGMVPYKIEKPRGCTAGENTREEGQHIVSTIHGQLVQNKRAIAVRDTLIINGPVGYRTGHISFPGDIVISGPVSDGFRIYSGKSLTIKNTFDVTEAITKGDILVTGGIIGRGQAIIKAGGKLRTRFIDNCRVASRQNITVLKEIVNCQVYSLGAVDLGDKGVILGSTVYSLNGVRAKMVGKKSSKISSIYCGIDFTIMQDKTRSTARLHENALRLGRYKNILEASDGMDAEKRKKLEEEIAQLEREQKGLGEHISALLTKVNANESAVVEVHGEVASGTYIEICQVGLAIDEPMRRVRFRLDSGAGRVVIEKLQT